MTGNKDMHLLVTECLKKGADLDVDINQSVSGVIMQRDSTPSLRVDQAVDCGLWNVVPLLINGCVKLLNIVGNWKPLSHTSI